MFCIIISKHIRSSVWRSKSGWYSPCRGGKEHVHCQFPTGCTQRTRRNCKVILSCLDNRVVTNIIRIILEVFCVQAVGNKWVRFFGMHLFIYLSIYLFIYLFIGLHCFMVLGLSPWPIWLLYSYSLYIDKGLNKPDLLYQQTLQFAHHN